jgi:hypothetical protein
VNHEDSPSGSNGWTCRDFIIWAEVIINGVGDQISSTAKANPHSKYPAPPAATG